MKNNLTTVTRLQANEGLLKAERQFGKKQFGPQLTNLTGIQGPYISMFRKYAITGDANDLPPSTCFDKFLAYLNTGNKMAPTNPVTTTESTTANDDCRTDKEVLSEIQLRFQMVSQSVSSIFRGGQSGVIVSGPAGCGKSYNVEQQINEEKDMLDDSFLYTHLKGANVTYTGLYQLLWAFRDGGVIVFDDSDKIWEDDTMMNTLKAAMDTSKTRHISTASGGRWVQDLADNAGVEIEEVQKFEFKGKIIFITNKDINDLIEKKRKNFEHFSALVDRSFYVDLEMFSLRAKYLWCEYIFMDFIAPQQGLSDDLVIEIMEFVSDNRYNLRGMSVREIEIIASVANDPVFAHNWRDFIKVTRFKRSK